MDTAHTQSVPAGTPRSTGTMNNDIPPTPKWLFFVYIAQIFFAILVLAVSAYAVHVFHGFGFVSGALGFAIFMALWTIIVSTALIVLPRSAPHLYFKWIILGVLTITTLWWLIAFAMLAAWANGDTYSDGYYYGYRLAKRSPRTKTKTGSSSYNDLPDNYNDLLNKVYTAWRCVCVAAAFGAVLWVLFIVTLVFFGLACHKYRTGHAGNTGVEGGIASTEPKLGHEMQNYGQQQQQQQPPQQQYQEQQNFQAQQPYVPTPAPEYQQQQQQQQYQQQQKYGSEHSYVPTPNPEQQFAHQNQHTQQNYTPAPVMEHQETGSSAHANPAFGNSTPSEMPAADTSKTEGPQHM